MGFSSKSVHSFRLSLKGLVALKRFPWHLNGFAALKWFQMGFCCMQRIFSFTKWFPFVFKGLCCIEMVSFVLKGFPHYQGFSLRHLHQKGISGIGKDLLTSERQFSLALKEFPSG